MTRIISALFYTSIASAPGIGLFVGLFWLGALSDSSPILMYRGIALACVACVAHGLLLWWFLRRVEGREYILLSAISLAYAANVIFLVVFPVTIDRSVSVYLLGQLSRHSTGMTEAELNERLINQYVLEYKGVSRRMREQILTGNVQVSGERYLLTEQGQAFIRFSDSVADVFGVDPRYIRSSGSSTQSRPHQ